MRDIYLDSRNMCHNSNAPGRTKVKTDLLDGICDAALIFYKFVPPDDERDALIQCIDTVSANEVEKAFAKKELENLEEVSDLVSEIESICNELIGE